MNVRHIILIFLCWSAGQALGQTRWTVSRGPSSVRFQVKHLVFSQVKGRFSRFEGKVFAPSGDFSDARIEAVITVDSVYTGHRDRDRSLLSKNFFDAERFPHMRFLSERVIKTGANQYRIHGALTIRGTTKPVVLDAVHQATRKNARGKELAVIVAKGEVNRYDFGLRWNAFVETGGAVVGETVRMNLKIVLVRDSNETIQVGSSQ